MKLTIDNFRGAEHAVINDEMISLVAGDNGAGKTSILIAAACALSGDMTPFEIKKAEGGALVRDGASAATALIETADGTARAEWPKCDRKTTGEPPFASEVAVGLQSLVYMSDKDRAVYLGELLKTDPTREDFEAALIAANIATADEGDKRKPHVSKYEKVWATVERDGWAAAHTRASENGRTQKGNWNQVTKENWGIKKGQEWQPEGWDSALASESLDSLEDAVTAARADVEHHVGRLAVSEDVVEQLQERAAKADERKATHDEAVATLEGYTAELAEINKQISEIGPRDNHAGMPCPHCGKGIVTVKKGAESSFEKPQEIDNATLKKNRTEFASADGARIRIEGEIRAAKVEADRAKEDYDASLDAKRQLDEGVSSDGANQEDVDKAREVERKAIRERDAFKTKVEADRIHNSILTNAAMVEILAASGVRHTVLKRALDDFNGKLAAICKAAKWGAVAVTESLGVEYRGRRYSLVSDGEKFRARVALQIACASADASQAVVIDGADILDLPGRGGLLAMLVKRGGRAIVGMTLPSVDKAPDLAARGVGSVYWIERGNFTAKQNEAEAA